MKTDLKHFEINPAIVERLVSLADEYDLEELTVTEDDLEITIRGHEPFTEPEPIRFPFYQTAPQPYVATGPFLPEYSAVATPAAAPAAPPNTGATPVYPTTPPKDESVVNITAPIVGVFYSRATPDAPPFVQVHDRIAVGDDIGLIEAMKVFSPSPSEVAGEVIEIVAKDGDLLQAGDVIMRVRV
ncbi:MAG: hypothetical protein J6332_06000 [Abditibacteriota bacterium]|nr:hypothetical protein [Abditibacteriota bacterium]